MSLFWLTQAERPGWAHDVTVTLLDRAQHHGRFLTRTYTYTATFRVESFAVRVRFRVAARRSQSSAVAEVLANDLTWTPLVDAETPENLLAPNVFAQELLWRACAVLLGLPGLQGEGA